MPPIKDMTQLLGSVQVLGAATLDADSTSAAIDLRDYRGCLILLSIGVGGITFDDTNKIDFVVTESNDDSTYAAVADADFDSDTTVATGGIIKSLTAEHAAAALYAFSYIGGKNYLKIKADFSGTHGTGTPISCVAVKGLPSLIPVS